MALRGSPNFKLYWKGNLLNDSSNVITNYTNFDRTADVEDTMGLGHIFNSEEHTGSFGLANPSVDYFVEYTPAGSIPADSIFTRIGVAEGAGTATGVLKVLWSGTLGGGDEDSDQIPCRVKMNDRSVAVKGGIKGKAEWSVAARVAADYVSIRP